MSDPDIRAVVVLEIDIPSLEYFSCPMMIDGEAYDGRIILRGKAINAGSTFEADIKFLDAIRAMPNLVIGKELFLWHGRVIGRAEVSRIYPNR